MVDSDNAMKALVTLAIEKTLLNIGKLVYDNVIDRLDKKYQCYMPDCFEKPEYLKAVLKELYVETYNEIVNSIQQELKEFVDNKRIERFLQVLL
jgi:hypothetical protein